MKAWKPNQKKSRKQFSRSAQKIHPKNNLKTGLKRGGIRL